MARFLIRNGPADLPELVLPPGTHQIGRHDTNHFQIPDASLSGRHCEITIDENGGVQVRDLDSTNGSFVDDVPIQEARLEGGQTLRLGTVELRLQPDAEVIAAVPAAPPQIRLARAAAPPPVAAVIAPAIVPPATPSRPGDCTNHPETPAEFVCQQCQRTLCQACVNVRSAGRESLYSCKVCDGICLERKQHEARVARSKATVLNSLPAAFKYPFRRDGMFLLFGGTLFFFLMGLAKYAFGWPRFFGYMMGIGYMFSCMQNIITSSAIGEEDMPDWPEFTNFWEDIILPFLQFVSIWTVCLVPGFVVFFQFSEVFSIPVFLLGVFLVPMCILAVSMANSFSGLNPLVVIPAILKVPGAYMIACFLLLLLLAVKTGFDALVGFVPIPILPSLAGTFVSLYLLIVQMRILGILYSLNKEKLAWY